MAENHTTVFKDMEHTFANVLTDSNQIDTAKLCLAVRSLIPMVDKFGIAFSFVSKDMLNNVKKIETYTAKNAGSSDTISALIKSELEKQQIEATQGLVWLTRGLILLFASLYRFVGTPGLQFKDAVSPVYDATLRTHHPWALKMVVSTALTQLHTRERFISILANDHAELEPQVLAELQLWLAEFEKTLRELTSELGLAYSNYALLKKKEGTDDYTSLRTVEPLIAGISL